MILLGIVAGFFLPVGGIRFFMTFNAIFGNFLKFFIPILILGLVTSGIARLGQNAGRLLLATIILAYSFTLFSGFFTFAVCEGVYPWLLAGELRLTSISNENIQSFPPFFTIVMEPFITVFSALLLSFILGIGISMTNANTLRQLADEGCDIVNKVIGRVIIPFLPLYIFGIFLEMTASGQVGMVLAVFIKLIAVIFVITLVMLAIQFGIAGAISHRNPLVLFRKMFPAYMTALGTQSSAATIPVTLRQTIDCEVRPEVANFVIPLCATIHLSGSTMKIVACSLAIIMLTGAEVGIAQYSGFICMLGITMVAAPGVPGGAIMAATGVLQSLLGFSDVETGLMIALYIAMDSFGTACNVTGDGAIATILNASVHSPRNPQ